MKSTTAITIVALAVGLASAAAAQNRPAATPAAASSASANASATAQTVQNALSLGQNGSALATQIRNDGLNICAKKADKKKCAPASP
jgi:hypothetical protein